MDYLLMGNFSVADPATLGLYPLTIQPSGTVGVFNVFIGTSTGIPQGTTPFNLLFFLLCVPTTP
jgi:hypothetical protein